MAETRWWVWESMMDLRLGVLLVTVVEAVMDGEGVDLFLRGVKGELVEAIGLELRVRCMLGFRDTYGGSGRDDVGGGETGPDPTLPSNLAIKLLRRLSFDGVGELDDTVEDEREEAGEGTCGGV
jgi:hypothetical protein